MAFQSSARAACSRCWAGSMTSSSSSKLSSTFHLAGSLPSTSYKPAAPLPSSSSFHTSATSLESRKRRTARLKKKQNLEQRELKVRMLEMSKPDFVLGHQPNPVGERVWNESELCKILLDKHQVWGVKEDRRGNLVPIDPHLVECSQDNRFDALNLSAAQKYGGPTRLNFGLRANDRRLLFQALPEVMVKDRLMDSERLGFILDESAPFQADIDAFEKEYTKLDAEEKGNASVLSRILDLRNASGKGIQVENTRRIIAHFGQGIDTGSPEVQAAVLTYRIRNLASHLETARHDNSNRRAMAMLVQQRAKILKYLKRKDSKRYNAILPRIGIEARAVEGEVVVPGKPKIATN
ncbi:hypothetical protein IE53DRAFT_390476 [Violaceomyces palustris]|uniref:Uncharacterized protein n=1 Tax=Violaceomyces palustris TaxID=1673888 RepID=A0ACD0NNQ1_9BASI|nr:hypothetical protein IE53DRAFT_390476 [Violaceomyces palustris]